MADNNDNDDIADNTPPPPPPPPSGDAFAPKDMFRDTPDDENGGLESGKPTVAASPTRVFIVLAIMGTLLLYLLYSIFFSSSDVPKEVEQPSRDVVKNNDGTMNVAPLPNFEEENIPAPPPLEPPPIPDPQNLPEITQEEDNSNNKALLDRLKSNIMIAGSGGSMFDDSDSTDEAEQQLAGTDGNLAFNNMVARSSSKASKVTATHIGALNRTIAQGRLIHATMESAINTDLPAPIRAIVARDVYAEAGTEPLIPKGSRLIGRYNSSILFGQNRVNVLWTRVIRPDGVDVALASPLVDQIGQAGVGGVVDNKFREMFSRAILASVFSIATAVALDESGLVDTQTTTLVEAGSQQTTSTASGEATVEALENMGDLTTEFLQRFINVKPTIVVDQGTPVMVFVNHDLIFPSQYVGAQQIP